MAQSVSWSATANADLQKLVKYLKTNTSEEFAQKVTDWYIREIDRLAENPAKGMVIDRIRGIRRWRLDKHNYVTFSIIPNGIIVKNILPYKLNKRGF